MPSQENGSPANVTANLPASVGITSSSNTTPIVVQTSAPHLLTSGDEVQINGHQGNVAANGLWPVMVVDATHVLLVGSTPSGVGTATGTVQSMGFGTTYAIPSDGDAFDAAAFNVAYEALGDRTASLLANSGRYKVLEIIDHETDDGTAQNTNWTGTHTFAAQNVWEQITASPIYSLGNILNVNDAIEVSFTGSVHAVNSGASVNNDVMLALYISFYPAGGSPVSFGRIDGSAVACGTPTTGGGYDVSTPVCLLGREDAIADQGFAIYLFGLTRNATPTNVSVSMLGDHQTRVRIDRPTDYTRLG